MVQASLGNYSEAGTQTQPHPATQAPKDLMANIDKDRVLGVKSNSRRHILIYVKIKGW